VAAPTLWARIALDSTHWDRGLRSVRRSMYQLRRDVGQPLGDLAGSLRTSASLMAGAFASISGYAVNRLIQGAGALQDMADKTGVAASQLALYQYIARQVGVELETVQRGIFKVGGASAFERGLAAIRSAPDENKIEVAKSIFGTMRGPSLIPVASQFELLRSEAEQLGVVLDDSVVSAADNAGDALSRLQATVVATATRLVPFDRLRAIFDQLTTAVGRFRTSSRFDDIKAGLADMAEGAVNAVVRAQEAWSALDSDTQTAFAAVIRNGGLFVAAWYSGVVGPFIRATWGMVTWSVQMIGKWPRLLGGALTAATGFFSGSWLASKANILAVFAKLGGLGAAVTRWLYQQGANWLRLAQYIASEMWAALFEFRLPKMDNLWAQFQRALKDGARDSQQILIDFWDNVDRINKLYPPVPIDENAFSIKNVLAGILSELGDVALPDSVQRFLDEFKAARGLDFTKAGPFASLAGRRAGGAVGADEGGLSGAVESIYREPLRVAVMGSLGRVKGAMSAATERKKEQAQIEKNTAKTWREVKRLNDYLISHSTDIGQPVWLGGTGL